MADKMLTRDAANCAAPWWECEQDLQSHIEDSIRSGEMNGTVCEMDGLDLEDVLPTEDDLADLTAMEEDADVIDEWNSYYMSTRL